MNFQAVRQANGQKVTLSAAAFSVEGTTHIPSGTPKQDCKFTDANGETQNVTIWQGKGQPLPVEKQGQTISINISYKQKGNRASYGGFWNNTAQVASLQPQPAPNQPPQGVSAAPESSKAPQTTPQDVITRHDVVCALLAGGGIDASAGGADYWVEYIRTGQVPSPPAVDRSQSQAAAQDIQDDGIPF